ncbi:MAG: VgrG-related protein, partial [Actinobacteria bacterium]|nr:VgrG-related protein [Actinomycetota bacterium]
MTKPYSPEVELSGSTLSDDWQSRIVRIVVDDNLQFPAMFELAFLDPDGSGLGSSGLEIGSEITVTARNDDGSVDVLTGEITALEGEYDVLGSVLVARGYEKSHRLHHGRKVKGWLEKSDADIVSEIAREAGVSTGTVDDTGVVHPYIVQAGMTDWEFLRARARAVGYDLAMEDGQLQFKAPTESSDAPGEGSYDNLGDRQLVLGANLISFRPRITAAEQVTSVEARGWDAAQKQAVTATAQAATKSAALTLTPSSLAGTVSAGTYVAVAEPHATADEAQVAADAIAERIGSAAIEAEGVATGSPSLRAGEAVSISGVNATFDGDYVLSGTRHVFDDTGYTTEFVISGRQERSLLGLTSAGATNDGPAALASLPGVVIGLVTDVGDEENQGRVKVKLPALSEDYTTDWARVAYVGAGSDRGLLMIPEVDDEVVVAFAHGDLRRPLVIGSLYNGQDKPKDASDAVSDGEVKKRTWTSRAGHKIEISDGDDDGGITIETSSGEKLQL